MICQKNWGEQAMLFFNTVLSNLFEFNHKKRLSAYQFLEKISQYNTGINLELTTPVLDSQLLWCKSDLALMETISEDAEFKKFQHLISEMNKKIFVTNIDYLAIVDSTFRKGSDLDAGGDEMEPGPAPVTAKAGVAAQAKADSLIVGSGVVTRTKKNITIPTNTTGEIIKIKPNGKVTVRFPALEHDFSGEELVVDDE